MPDQDAITIASPVQQAGRPGEVWLAQAMYFGFYMAAGALVPFLNLYYQRLGLSAPQIGLLAALPVFISSTTSVIWGGLADTFRLHRLILRGALLLVPVVVLVLSQVVQFEHLLLVLAVYAFLGTPILPLIDSAALEVAAEHGRTYGGLRVWGTVGWSVATWLVGTLIEAKGIRLMFYAYAALIGLTFVLSLFQSARRQTLRAPLRQGLRELLLRWDFVVFLVSIFLVAMTSSAVMAFYSLYMDTIGATEGTIGLAWTLAAVSEIPTLSLSGAILRRIGARGLLKIAFAAYAVRWLILSFATEPLWAVMTQLLHGLSFGAFLIGGVTYVNQRTPPGMGSTAQAVYTTVTFGLASIAGSLVGGYLYDQLDPAAYFRVLSLVAALGLLVFWSRPETARPPALSSPDPVV